MNLLQKRIKEASQKYYTDGTSDISDAEFDALLEEERKQNPDSELLGVGHGYDVSKDTTYGKKVKHKYGLVGSLDKFHNYKEISTSIKNIIESGEDIICSLKEDGISCVLYYNEGKLVSALTRGDGTTGIEILEKAKYILNKSGLGESLSDNFTGAVRGELVMSESDFEAFHRIHPESKNPRNSTAGLVNGKEITDDFKFLNLVVYTIVGCENKVFANYAAILQFLQNNFKDVVQYDITSKNQIHADSLEDYMDQLKSKWYGNYPADGIVMAMNTVHYENNSVLYDSMAYKFPTPVVKTKVTDIVWDLSKTGYLIPRIQFDPVEIEGSTVQYCAGHNAQNIKDLGVGIGSEIQVTKANSIIPYLVHVDTTSYYLLPDKCPSCGGKLVMNGVHLQCQNNKCKNSDIQDTLVWLDNIVPVDGLGDTLKLRFLSDVFGESNISIESMMNHGPIEHMEAENSVKGKLFIETFNRMFSDKVGIESAVKGLNIPRFGDVTAKKLSDPKYTDDIKLLIAGKDPSANLESIGKANYKSILENKDKFQRLRFLGDRLVFNTLEATLPAEADVKKVVVTGKLETCTRKEFKELLASKGYQLTETLNKETTFLITNNPEGTSSKNKKADKLGIEKITEKDFLDKYINSTESEAESEQVDDVPDMYIIHPELCSQKHITVTVGNKQDPEVPYVVVHFNSIAGPKYLCCIRLDTGEYYNEVKNSPIDEYLEEFWDIMMSGWGFMNVLLRMRFSDATYRTATGYESAVQIWCNYFRPGMSIQETGLFEQTPQGIPIAPDFDVLKQK